MNKLRDFKDKIINKIKRIKREHLISKYISENKIFVLFVLVNVINSTLLRVLTMPTLENILLLKPIIADLAVTIIFGSFNFFFKRNKSQTIYLSVLTIIFTVLCTINSVYYTFYTSFASFSMLSLAQFIAPVGDAVVENVLQIKDLLYIIPAVSFFIYVFINKKNIRYKVTIKKKRHDNFFKSITAFLNSS